MSKPGEQLIGKEAFVSDVNIYLRKGSGTLSGERGPVLQINIDMTKYNTNNPARSFTDREDMQVSTVFDYGVRTGETLESTYYVDGKKLFDPWKFGEKPWDECRFDLHQIVTLGEVLYQAHQHGDSKMEASIAALISGYAQDLKQRTAVPGRQPLRY